MGVQLVDRSCCAVGDGWPDDPVGLPLFVFGCRWGLREIMERVGFL